MPRLQVGILYDQTYSLTTIRASNGIDSVYMNGPAVFSSATAMQDFNISKCFIGRSWNSTERNTDVDVRAFLLYDRRLTADG